MERQGRRGSGGDLFDALQEQIVGMLGQTNRPFVVEASQPVERQFPPMPAEQPGGCWGESLEVIEGETASLMACQFLSHIVGYRDKLIEIEVAVVKGEFPGYREREPQQPVEVEVGLVVGEDGVGLARGVGLGRGVQGSQTVDRV
jgi:hypothetical protein